MTDTIAAISTPLGSGGIGVIRISGPEAIDVASGLFGRKKTGPTDCRSLESHRVYHGYIFDPDRRQSGMDIIDEVLLIPMLAPSSYTAEDVVEIQAHSGTIVLRSVLDLVLSMGVRMAEPGEFTKRAFLNQRIDLTQAEAVTDIINARSNASLKFAASQNMGALKERIQALTEPLVDILAHVEASIDFPDETDAFQPGSNEIEAIRRIVDRCNELIQQHNDACFLKDGIRVSICGAPNVGKSSLMNRLVNQEKSIVTALPGTTRDPIQEGLNLNGVPFVICDTAGIHKTDDLVEIIGIEKAKDHINQSDLVLWVTEPLSTLNPDHIRSMVPESKNTILVLNKSDLLDTEGSYRFPEALNQLPRARVSALHNHGVDELKEIMINLSIKELDLERSSVIPNLRHKKALQRAVKELETARQSMIDHIDHEMLAIDIKNALDALGMITGETAQLDILDTIFSNFCIGK